MRENHKVQEVMNFVDIATDTSSKMEVSFLSFHSQSEVFYLKRTTIIKYRLFVFASQSRLSESPENCWHYWYIPAFGFYSQQLQIWLLQSGLLSKTSHMKKMAPLKHLRLWFLHDIYSPETEKPANNTESSQLTDSCFSVNTSLVSLSSVEIKNFTLRQWETEYSFLLFLAWESW